MKVGALVPMRLWSERLREKGLRFMGGRRLVEHLVDRLRATRHVDPDAVVVCTTTDPRDDALVPVVEAAGGQVFRGHPDDLIDRLCSAAAAFDLDIAVEVDGDDPFVDVEYVDACVEALLADPAMEVAVTVGLPLGLNLKAIRREGFERVRRAYRTAQNDTGFGLYFTHLCPTVKLPPRSPDHRHDTARVTIDYDFDVAFGDAVVRELSPRGELFGVGDLVALLRRRPDLVAMNTHISEEYWARTRAKVNLAYEGEGGEGWIRWEG